jgi:hypothetical protein
LNRLATAAATVLAAASLAACGGGGARPAAAPNEPSQSRVADAQASVATPNAAQPDRATAPVPRGTPKPHQKAAAAGPVAAARNARGGTVVVPKQDAANVLRSVLEDNPQRRPRSPRTNSSPLAQVLKAFNKSGKKPAPASKPSRGGSSLALPGLSGSK